VGILAYVRVNDAENDGRKQVLPQQTDRDQW
jgi:hypothetical protein